MQSNKLICNSSNFAYDKGYITLQCQDYDLPDTFVVDEDTLVRKDHFHISLLCVKNILESQPEAEADILKYFCDFLKDNEISFQGFTKEFRLANDRERKSVVALCKVSNLTRLSDYIGQKIGIAIAHQPAHVTIYTLQPNIGIGLNSSEEMDRKSVKLNVPDIILSPLMGYKRIIVVDEDDREIGAEYMMDAINKGLIRRVSRVYVFNESGQLLVQQRSEHVLKPLMLDQSAAGHLDIGETYEQAAYRELKEELGLENITLDLIATSLRTTEFYNAVYKLVIPDNTEINYDPFELKTILWYDTNDLDVEMVDHPEKFTLGFRESWALLRDKLI